MERKYGHLGHPKYHLSELWISALPIDYAALSLWLEVVHEWMRLDSSMIPDVGTFSVQLSCSVSYSEYRRQLVKLSLREHVSKPKLNLKQPMLILNLP